MKTEESTRTIPPVFPTDFQIIETRNADGSVSYHHPVDPAGACDVETNEQDLEDLLECVEEYKRVVLSNLDPAKVYADLSDAILLCWERPGEDCHRRLVAEWIESSLGVKVPEM